MVEPTWRLLTEIDGETSELVSVRERNSGDLIIVCSKADMFGTVENSPYPIKSQKYSVHVSPKSSGNLIKQSTHGDHEWKVAALVMPGPQGLIWPIVMSRMADLRIPAYRKKPKPGERFDKFPSFDPDLNSPVICIVVTDRYVSLPYGPLLDYRVEFSKFKVTVFGGFMPVPSLGKGHDQVFATSAQTKNDEVPSWFTEGGRTAPNEVQLYFMMQKAAATLADAYVINYLQACEAAGVEVTDQRRAEIAELAEHMGPNPIDRASSETESAD